MESDGGGRSDAIKVGALEAMRDLAQPILEDEIFQRDTFIGAWLKEQVQASNRLAALRYLADHGLPQDLKFIELELERKHSQTASVAADAILRITLRESRSQALTSLLDLQPDTVDPLLVSAIFDPPTGLSSEDLRKALLHRNASVRAAAMAVVSTQSDFTDEEVAALLVDPDLSLRLETMKHLASKGYQFSDEEKQRHLVIKGRPGGLFGIGGTSQTRIPDFESWSLRKASDDELAKQHRPFNAEASTVLYERHFTQRAAELRQAVASQFKGRWEADVKGIADTAGAPETLLTEIRKSEDMVRRAMTRAGLDVLCRRGGVEDLVLVRQLMDGSFVNYSSDEVEFIRKHGEWEDIARLLAAVGRPADTSSATGLLAFSGMGAVERQYAETARAMIALGRDRIDELLALKMPDELRRRLVVELPEAAIGGISDSALLALFALDHAGTRKAIALRIVRALPRKRIQDLLDRYQQQTYRYYNVLVWLDLGVSLSRSVARATAERVLRRPSR